MTASLLAEDAPGASSQRWKPAGGIAAVNVGARYRAYYVIDQGARVQEIDLE